jgi:hypothetical protein
MEKAPTPYRDAWSGLQALIDKDPDGEMAALAAITEGALEERGVWASGQSAIRARQVAAAYGYRWDENRKRFYRPWHAHALPIIGALFGTWLLIAPWLFRSDQDSVAELVAATATALAALVALALAFVQWRRPGPPAWYVDRVLAETQAARDLGRTYKP